MELCCFGKYIAIDHILSNKKNHPVCFYLDGDLFFLSNIKSLLKIIKEYAFILTPHYLNSCEKIEVEIETLVSGWINAGFFVANRDSLFFKKIINWLISRISQKGFMIPEIGLYCDQKWLAEASQLFNEAMYISKDKSLNVAYWNLHERQISKHKNNFYINNKKLIFFHFSGYDPHEPFLLSKHVKIDINNNHCLKDLLLKYKKEFSDLRLQKRDFNLINFSKSNLKKRISISSKYYKDNNIISSLLPSKFNKIKNLFK